jgi:hypothetical protein
MGGVAGSFVAGGLAGALGGAGVANQSAGAGGTSPEGGTPSSGGTTLLGGAGQGGAVSGGAPAGGSAGNGGQNSAGASGSPGTPNAFSQVQSLLESKCAQCHTLGGNQPDLSAVSEELYTTLSTYRVRDCGDNPLVNPGNPTTSALVMVTTAGKCRNRLVMPAGCVGESCVTSRDRQLISDWITQGAKH